jgi:protein SCO1/2
VFTKIKLLKTIKIGGIFLASFLFLFFLYYQFGGNQDREIIVLPNYGPIQISAKGDTLAHQVSSFSFVNQFGQTVNEKNFDGCIYVADFFFTTCQSICPKMSNSLLRVQKAFSNNPRIKILSHTVMPEEDNSEVLRVYANQFKARPGKWEFVTGSKKELYRMARDQYFVVEDKGNGDENDFIHTQMFVLVDRHKNIRGYYEGTDSLDVNRLIKEIKMVERENEYTKEFTKIKTLNLVINKLRLHGCLKIN